MSTSTTLHTIALRQGLSLDPETLYFLARLAGKLLESSRPWPTSAGITGVYVSAEGLAFISSCLRASALTHGVSLPRYSRAVVLIP